MQAEEYISPDWANKGKCNDWKNYASEELTRIWPTFTTEQRRVVAEALQEAAYLEEWG
ncbi:MULTISPECIES: recombinase RecA [Klebsiella pneumoniae complex]|uniref:recombinase RecA n=1 Tax=Klebsiella pneumoniae complex TaxID=3390273 RepID=UPI0010F49E04|nr:recombinase RecA [Klebsiella variicola]